MSSPSNPAAVVIEIRTTFASRVAAETCAARLVAERCVACVQVEGPISSTYRWRDVVEHAEEWRCTCKTAAAREAACIAAIVSAHDYDTPEVIVARVGASAAYAEWVRASVGEG
jgi:uncharacterized protein involved in tolerance to divalent cations